MRRHLLAAAAVVAATAGSLPATAHAKASQDTYFEAPRELVSGGPATRAAALDEIAALGSDGVRIVLYWTAVAPSATSASRPSFDERDPAAYDWAGYEAAVAGAKARGLDVLMTLSGPVPRWATAKRRDHVTRPSATRFERFATAAARQFSARVDRWSAWNEPNHPQFLGPQFTGSGSRRRAASPGIYRGLVRGMERGLRAGGAGSAPLLIGETAPRGTSRVVAPLAFLRGTLGLSSRYDRRSGYGRLPVDGWAHHPYTTSAGPWFVPTDRDDVTIGVLSRLNSALARAERAKVVRRTFPVYLTEFGIQSRPDPVAVSEARQADYRSIAERMADGNGRVRAFSQYLLRDDVPGEGSDRYGGFESGLRHSGGEAKPALEGFRLPLAARRRGRSSVSLWGLVRPASSRTAVTVEYLPRGSSRWRRLKERTTDARGRFSTTTRYTSGRRYRVVWTDPAGIRRAGSTTTVYRR